MMSMESVTGRVVRTKSGSEKDYIVLSDGASGAKVEVIAIGDNPSQAARIWDKDLKAEISVDLASRQQVFLSDFEILDKDYGLNNVKTILKALMKKDMRLYHDLFHSDKMAKTFEFGKTRLPVAGRVYDHEEMNNLLESNLKFFLTTEKFDMKFCQSLGKFLKSKNTPKVNVLTTNSGSSANLLAVSALTSHKLHERRMKPGDEVITVAAGFPTTVAPIFQNGLKPVFVDVELGSYNINPALIEKAISPKTKAIFVAHTLGIPFDLDAILAIAEKHKLWVIEDSCDALGAEYTLSRKYDLIDGKTAEGSGFVGTFGHIGTTSFYPAHQMTMGEGGAVFTADENLRTILLSFRDWGRDCYCDPGKDDTCKKRFGWQLGRLPQGYDHKYTYSHLGYNLKITDMQAAVGCAQLEKLPSFINKRRENWHFLREDLKDLEKYFIFPSAPAKSNPSPFGFTLSVRENAGFTRNELTQHLESKKIQTRVVFAGNILKQPALTETDLDYKVGSDLSNTDYVMDQTFWVGVYPGLNRDMLKCVSLEIRKFVEGYK